MLDFQEKLLFQNISVKIFLEDPEITDWTVWTQEGPSEDTLLVSLQHGHAFSWDDLFGYNFFPLPTDHLAKCGWIPVGEL